MERDEHQQQENVHLLVGLGNHTGSPQASRPLQQYPWTEQRPSCLPSPGNRPLSLTCPFWAGYLSTIRQSTKRGRWRQIQSVERMIWWIAVVFVASLCLASRSSRQSTTRRSISSGSSNSRQSSDRKSVLMMIVVTSFLS